MTTDNMKLWNEVCKTDPAHTKSFKGKGGFEGTAISPMYMIRRATERWGPMGGRWGVRIISDELMPGAPMFDAKGETIGVEYIHKVQAEVFFPIGDESVPRGAIPCFGQTQFVGRNKNGFFTDEEAPKKSLTDALTKGLSWLGFAADIHMGLYDDNKYVNAIKDEFTKGYVTPVQASALNDILMAHQMDTGRFLAWASAAAKHKVACVEQLPVDLFEKAKKILEDEAKKAGAA